MAAILPARLEPNGPWSVTCHHRSMAVLIASNLRKYVLSGAADLVATERELRRLEEAMAGGADDAATLAAYARAQARLEHAGGSAGREPAPPLLPRLRFCGA